MNTQSIIVYRNPIEAAFWEGGYLIPIMGGLGVGFILFLVLMKLAERILGARGISNPVLVGVAVVSLIAAFMTFTHLML